MEKEVLECIKRRFRLEEEYREAHAKASQEINQLLKETDVINKIETICNKYKVAMEIPISPYTSYYNSWGLNDKFSEIFNDILLDKDGEFLEDENGNELYIYNLENSSLLEISDIEKQPSYMREKFPLSHYYGWNASNLC